MLIATKRCGLTARVISKTQLLMYFVLFCLWSQFVHASQTIPFYTYYDEPPFALEQADNLTQKLADWLSKKSKGQYQFVPTYLPRRRLDLTVLSQADWQGVVVWASPQFFLDQERSKYLWTDTYMHDINLVVSHRNKPINFNGPASLYGLTVGSVIGHQLDDFQRDIAAGRIHREDAGSALSNLKKLQLQRIDAAFIPAIALPYYRQQLPQLDQWLYIAKQPRSEVYRHLFVARSQVRLHRFLNQAIVQLAHDKQWQAVIAHRHTKPPTP